MGFRFVNPTNNSTRLEIGDGDWVEVKNELTAGERKKMLASGLTHVQGKQNADPDEDVTVGIDFKKYGLSKVAAYILDWNAKDEQSRPVPYSIEAIQQLDQDTFDRIEKALDAHIEAQREAKKKTSGERKPEAS